MKRLQSLFTLYPWAVSLLTAICFIALFFESVPYLKYIVTSLHLNTGVFQLILLVVWLPMLFLKKRNYSKLMIIILLLCVVGESTAKSGLLIFRELRNIVANPLLTYDQKMSNTFKDLYSAMKEVARLTPPDSTIIIPPQRNPWEMEGHTGIVRYFIYPRKVVNMSIDATDIPRVEGKMYVLIAKGSWEKTGEVDYGWPKIPISAKRIWHINTKQNTTQELSEHYYPEQHKWDWGLIEVNIK